MNAWRLVSDVGGTNARFARALSDGILLDHRGYCVAQYSSYIDALRTYLEDTGKPEGCASAAIGAAGPVDAGTVTLTNAAWCISEAEVSAALGVPSILVNDLEAAAFSLPTLADDDLFYFGAPAHRSREPKRFLAANAGTGFGAATLIRTASGWISCPGEAGHASVGAACLHEYGLQDTFTCVEHVLSGSGLSELYRAVAKTSNAFAAAEIFARAKSDPYAATALQLFTKILASTVGNLVLGVAAWDGVFLFGSVAKGFAGVADLRVFRQVFEDKGAMRDRMARVPVALVLKEDAALVGLAVLPISS